MNKITVNMTKETLYDFLLYHAYSKFSGFLINILGFAIIIMGLILYLGGNAELKNFIFFCVAGVVFLAATPLQLKMRAKKQVVVNREYNCPADYTFSEDGIVIEQNGEVREFLWEQIERAVVTPKTIGIYYGKDLAMIIPKSDFGDQFVPIYTTIATQLGLVKAGMKEEFKNSGESNS